MVAAALSRSVPSGPSEVRPAVSPIELKAFPREPQMLSSVNGRAQRQLVQRIGEGVDLVIELPVRERADLVEEHLVPAAP